jgi:hypothetical protein
VPAIVGEGVGLLEKPGLPLLKKKLSGCFGGKMLVSETAPECLGGKKLEWVSPTTLVIIGHATTEDFCCSHCGETVCSCNP